MAVFLLLSGIVPQKSEVSQHDQRVAFFQARNRFFLEAVDLAVGVSCHIDHKSQSLRAKNALKHFIILIKTAIIAETPICQDTLPPARFCGCGRPHPGQREAGAVGYLAGQPPAAPVFRIYFIAF